MIGVVRVLVLAVAVLAAGNVAAQVAPRLYTEPILPKPGVNVFVKGFNLGLPPGTTPSTIVHGPSLPAAGSLVPPFAYQAGSLPQLVVFLGPVENGTYTVDVYADPHPSSTSVPLASLTFHVADRELLTVVEYFNAASGDYFLTADAGETRALDAGTVPGWTRTGESFHAFPATALPSSASPVCRFYGRPEFGLDTHFFSADRWECDAVRNLWPDRWVEETSSAFGVDMDYPLSDFDRFYDPEDADCVPLYRLWNGGAGARHRYLTSGLALEQMLAMGWILEGRFVGPNRRAYAMCVPK